jgi:hypothetical protein
MSDTIFKYIIENFQVGVTRRMKDKENERDAAEMELSKHNLARIDERERHMVSIRPNNYCPLELFIDV